MLELLPLEILFSLAETLLPSDLRALSHTSSRLYSKLAFWLYRSATFHATSEWALNELDVEWFFQCHRDYAVERLQHIRCLELKAPVLIARFNRCAYHNIFRTLPSSARRSNIGTAHEPTAHAAFLADLHNQVRLLLSGLRGNSLHSFLWHLGICLPPGILSEGGYLCKSQPNLADLSVVTDGTCPHAGYELEGLLRLSSLENLAWDGIQCPSEIQALRGCLVKNHPHLKSLTISFISCSSLPDRDDVLFLTPSRLERPDGQLSDAVSFPTLSSLCITKYHFPSLDIQSELCPRFERLRSLTMRECSNQIPFLRYLARADTEIRLLHFEVSSDYSCQERPDYDEPFMIIDFLVSFRGLERLHLKFSNLWGTLPGVHQAIRHHQATLRSFIYHERQLVPIHTGSLFQEVRDVTPHSTHDIVQAIGQSQVRLLGIPLDPFVAESYLQTIVNTSAVQLLHLRFCGTERTHRDIEFEVLYELLDKGILQTNWCGSHGACYRPECGRDERAMNDDDSSCSTVRDYAFADSEFPAKPPAAFLDARRLLSFASWAFGPTGLSNLQVLAFGDFSHDLRYRKQQVLFCRKANMPWRDMGLGYYTTSIDGSLPFFPARVVDLELWNRRNPFDGFPFLSACPTGSLTVSPYDL